MSSLFNVYGSGFHFRSFEVQSTQHPPLFFIIRILYFFNLLGIPIESLYVQTNITKMHKAKDQDLAFSYIGGFFFSQVDGKASLRLFPCDL